MLEGETRSGLPGPEDRMWRPGRGVDPPEVWFDERPWRPRPGSSGCPMEMKKMQRLELLWTLLEELEIWIDRGEVLLEEWRFDGEPWALGAEWPQPHGLRVLESQAEVPAEWPLEETRLELDIRGEAVLSLDYPAAAETRRFGLDGHHRHFPIAGRQFTIRADAVPFGTQCPHHGDHDPRPRLRQARLVWLDQAVVGLARLLRFVLHTIPVVENDQARDELLALAEDTFAALDLPSATEPYVARRVRTDLLDHLWEPPADLDPSPADLDPERRATISAVHESLRRSLERMCAKFPPLGSIALVGHSHIDLAWLWTIAETQRKVMRTFNSAADLMRRYPEFLFSESQPQLFAYVEEQDPELFEEIKQWVTEGRWELLGGMWIEPDTNLPSGESLVRQLLYGQRYFDSRFGRRATVGWLPDTFGFSAALPQLLVGAGMDSFFTQKLNDADTNRFPYDLFWWEGPDGSRVLSHNFDAPGNEEGGGWEAIIDPRELLGTWQNYRAKLLHPESLLTFGYGDGGGGPTAEHMERAAALRGFPIVPSFRITTADDFFARARAEADPAAIPIWQGEMYYELHRGTLTSQGRTKSLHRRAEQNLVAAELLRCLAWMAGGDEPESLEPDWQVLMRNQFHDILTGSCIYEVAVEAEDDLNALNTRVDDAIDDGMARLADRLLTPSSDQTIFVVNPSLSPRPLRLELEGEHPGAQKTENGSVVAGAQVVAGLSASTVTEATPADGLSVSESHLENELVRVELAADGTLERVYDKVADREVLTDRGNQIWAFRDITRTEDAWEVDPDYRRVGQEILSPSGPTIIEQGPHRAALRFERPFRDSHITQEIRLWANSARIDFATTFDWHDRHWLLRVFFPVAVRSRTASFENAFCVVERPTHRNTSWDQAQFEAAGHRFVDLSEPGYGVALLNNGRYGYDVLRNEIGLSLMNSPVYPDPRAEEGTSTVTYALFPHAGGWVEGGVLREAEDLNLPLIARPVESESLEQWQPIRLSGLDIAFAALKRLEDGGGMVLRIYEPQGARGAVTIDVDSPWKLGPEVSILEEQQEDPGGVFGPFQVRTFSVVPR
jgi:alpha-mannosidase